VLGTDRSDSFRSNGVDGTTPNRCADFGRLAIKFDLPFPSIVLYARAGITALGVQHTAVQPLHLRRLVKPVDASSIIAGGAADEHGRSSRVFRGDGSRLRGGMLSGLRKNNTKTTSHKTRKKGTWQRGEREGRGERLQLWRVRMLAGAQAAASDLPHSFRTRHKRAALAVVRGMVGVGDIRDWEIVTICSESRRASRTL
jgi:hypothetical protein